MCAARPFIASPARISGAAAGDAAKATQIALEIALAFRTLHRLPHADAHYRIALRSWWPDIPDDWPSGHYRETFVRAALPGPREIDRMDVVLFEWLPLLADGRRPAKWHLDGDPRLAINWVRLPSDTAKIVYLRAMGYSWRGINRARDKQSFEQSRRIHRGALAYLTTCVELL